MHFVCGPLTINTAASRARPLLFHSNTLVTKHMFQGNDIKAPPCLQCNWQSTVTHTLHRSNPLVKYANTRYDHPWTPHCIEFTQRKTKIILLIYLLLLLSIWTRYSVSCTVSKEIMARWQMHRGWSARGEILLGVAVSVKVRV